MRAQSEASNTIGREGRHEILSSKASFERYLMPVLWFLLWAWGAGVLLYLMVEVGTSDAARRASLIPWLEFLAIAGTMLLLWTAPFADWILNAVRLRDVMLENDRLVISGYRKTVRVPVSWVEKVESSRWTPLRRRITISFDRRTEMGHQVTFRPKEAVLLWPWKRDPSAERIRELISRSKPASQD